MFRLPISRFMSLLQTKILPEWSSERNPNAINCKSFSISPTKTTTIWTYAYQFANESRSMLSKTNPNGTTDFYIAASGNKVFNSGQVNRRFANWHGAVSTNTLRCVHRCGTCAYWKRSGKRLHAHAQFT